jgi:hypothetical protein
MSTAARPSCGVKDVDLVTADTVEYENPDDVTVVFMNNPLPGANFAAVVQHILESYDRNPRPPCEWSTPTPSRKPNFCPPVASS